MTLSIQVQPVAAMYGTTHYSLTGKALDILENEYNLDISGLRSNLGKIREGNLWADNDAENLMRGWHYQEAWFHAGVFFHPPAGDVATWGMNDAISSYNAGEYEDAFFWVGFALHHLQDLMIPGHSDVILLGLFQHDEYEEYCHDNEGTLSSGVNDAIFTFSQSGIHHNPSTVFGWVDYACHISTQYQSQCLAKYYKDVSEILMPIALRLTAGFLLFAYHLLDSSIDVDGDGLTYAEEVQQGTLAWNSDSDGDNLNDGDEIANLTNPLDSDSDNDGLDDNTEVNFYHTNPNKMDSDNDGWSDLYEITRGYDPNDSSSHPLPRPPFLP
ncbi:MAG: hypothetical protein ACFFED_09845 [Candidatus Thorarchaeota archaeon]